jgi:hypothetical protein
MKDCGKCYECQVKARKAELKALGFTSRFPVVQAFWRGLRGK